MTDYVCGFAISPPQPAITGIKMPIQYVLLVEKVRPTWQAGKFNGLGGRVDDGEDAADAMAREFREETVGRLVGSALYRASGWKHAVTLKGHDWRCGFFFGTIARADILMLDGRATDNGERLRVLTLANLFDGRVLPNCRWLIPFCLSHHEYDPEVLPLILPEKYHGAVIASAKGLSV